jgi:calmodulin
MKVRYHFNPSQPISDHAMTDGDGVVTPRDLHKETYFLNGLLLSEGEKAELRTTINEVNANGNGAITFLEYLIMMIRRVRGTTSEEIKESFKVFDKDGNGYISAAELRHGMINLGRHLSFSPVGPYSLGSHNL